MMLSAVVEAVLIAGRVEHDPPIVRQLCDVIAAGAWTRSGVNVALVVAILSRARHSLDFAGECRVAGALVHATRRD